MQADRVGKYFIIAKLGEGGMATVYLSCVPGPGGFHKLLVIKLLKGDYEHDEDFLAMFLNEARIAARLNHPNVVQTYEVGVDGARHFLAMDYLDGQPLHVVLRKLGRAHMPLELHVRVLADVLAGLQYAHTLRDFDGTPLGVVHRDVSPQNVFVTYDGQVKLVDFGIAKATGASSSTQSGMFKGKLAYMAPEQAGGDQVDARTDLFAVGVMLWEAMAGQRLAQNDGQTAILGRRLSGQEPRIREVRPDADPELSAICDRAMAHRAQDRYATADEFREALEAWLDHRTVRRVGGREVGELVARAFAEEREHIRRVIDEQMRRLLRETSTVLPVPLLSVAPPSSMDATGSAIDRSAATRRFASHDALPAAHELGGPASISGAHSTVISADVSQAAAPAPAGGRGVLFGLGAMAVASVIGIAVLLSLKLQPASQAAAPSAAPSTSAEADKVRVAIAFGPTGAVARLDGVPLADNPFVAQVARDGSMHRVDVEGPGLKPETRMVSYEKSVSITVTLGPAEPAAVEPSGSAAVAAPPSAPVLGGPWPTGGPPGAPTGEPWKRPGAKPAKSASPIDEKDPYKP
jgi:serine/threonine-protein kinase